MKLLRVPHAVEGTVQLGSPVSVIFPLGVISLVMLVLLIWGVLWLRDARLRTLVPLRAE